MTTFNFYPPVCLHCLDALRRVQSITNAQSATASLSYNALDSVTQASDFKGVATSYERDALGNAKTEASPDAGTQAAQYDSLGLPSSITNALGQATTIVRDSLGRPTSITHGGSAGVPSQTTTLRIRGSTLTKKRACTTTTSGAMTAGRGGIRRVIPLGWMGGGIGLDMSMVIY